MNPLALLTDYHAHRCGSCGTRWCHARSSLADHRAAHTCPSCGAAQYWVADFPVLGWALVALIAVAALSVP